jgi:rod shape-determining protein MreC
MSNKLKFFILIGAFVFVSLQYGSNARYAVSQLSTKTIEVYLSIIQGIHDRIEEHFFQQESIKKLREKNRELEEAALLSVAFASKLNNLLEAQGKSEYDPKLTLVQAISYANLGNHYRVWLDFDDFNTSKIYGLVYQGYTAGIVVSEHGKPLGLLQGDPKSIFSVNVGKDRIPGVAVGNGENIQVKYMPQWTEPKVGDEVVTSGLDTIFFAGIPVGVVTQVVQEESYQSAIVKPYAKVSAPLYMYAIK